METIPDQVHKECKGQEHPHIFMHVMNISLGSSEKATKSFLMNYVSSWWYSFFIWNMLLPIIVARCDKCTPEIDSAVSPTWSLHFQSSSAHWNIFFFFLNPILFFLNFQPRNNSSFAAFNSAVLLSHFNPQLLVCSSSSPLLSHTGITSSDYNNNSNELAGKWQLRSDRSSGLNWFTAAHNGFYSQGPSLTNSTHMLQVHL